MQKAIEGQLPGRFDLITWIPVSEETLKKRGYDQARLLAEALGQLLQTPVLAALAQPRAKVPQSTLLSPQARRENVKGCFALRNPAALKGKRILLIDDVITTGATLEEACETLCHAEVQEVVCATFCRARKEDTLGEAPSS
jgi:ComF family protein